RFLAGGDNRFGLPDYKNFNKLTLDDVRSWITQSIGNDDIEVSVVGDFDIESTIKLTAKYFGSLSLKPIINEQKEKSFPLFPVGQSKMISALTKIQKGLIVVAYPTEDLWDISRTREHAVYLFFRQLFQKGSVSRYGKSWGPHILRSLLTGRVVFTRDMGFFRQGFMSIPKKQMS
ncbi:MAG: insulinase family protein, partial [Deltaproteobacteria bacterium]|nr:insulinase family protein [Deltaproteobacteria bacterium]